MGDQRIVNVRRTEIKPEAVVLSTGPAMLEDSADLQSLNHDSQEAVPDQGRYRNDAVTAADEVTFLQALRTLEANCGTPPTANALSRLCRCFKNPPTQGYLKLKQLERIQFTYKCVLHRQLLSTCVTFLTGKDSNAVSMKKSLPYLSKGQSYSQSLQTELEREGTVLNLLFIVYLKDSLGTALKTRLDALGIIVPLLAFFTFANPQYWKFVERQRDGIGDSIEDAFARTLDFFMRWISELAEDVKWDDKRHLLKAIQQEPPA